MQNLAFEAKELICFAGDAVNDREQILQPRELNQYHAEQVAAEVADKVRLSGNPADAERHLTNCSIAGPVSIVFVDPLQTVHTDQQNGQGINLPPARRTLF